MAFRLLGESHIPAIIEQADDQRSAALAIVENLQRQQLNFYEEARAIATLMESGPLTQKQVAEQLGLSQPARRQQTAASEAARVGRPSVD